MRETIINISFLIGLGVFAWFIDERLPAVTKRTNKYRLNGRIRDRH